MQPDEESWVHLLRRHVSSVKLALDLLASEDDRSPYREHLLLRAKAGTERLAAELRQPPAAAARIPADRHRADEAA